MTPKALLLNAIEREPGVTMLQLSERTGFSPGAVWQLMSALRQEGRIKRSELGWVVVRRVSE
jgi:DNA-binding Lrp family transcriptional regulator